MDFSAPLGQREAGGRARPRPSSSPLAILAAGTLIAVPYVLTSALHGIGRVDDEGTLMSGFRSLMDGHRMYDEIYSLYGPLYAEVYGLLFAWLGLPLTHTAWRLLAAAVWLAYAAGFALCCHQWTRSVSATALAYALILVWLRELMNSPGHPEELCLVMLAGVLLLGCRMDGRPTAAGAAAAGALVAGLALTKINVGALVGGGVALALLPAVAPRRWRRVAVWILMAGLLASPIALEYQLIDFGWVETSCAFCVLTIGASLIALRARPPQSELPVRHLSIALASGAATVIVVVEMMMLAGSSAFAIANAAVLQNAHFVRNWYLPSHIELPGLLTAIVSALAAAAYALSGRSPYHERGVLVIKAGFVIVGGLLFAWTGQVFRELVPFCWLLVVPSGNERLDGGRRLAGLVGAMLSLYAFPVAGHQLRIAALVPVMMLPVMTHDVLTGLRALGFGARFVTASRAAFVMVSAALLFGAGATTQSARAYWRDEPLGLPGTRLIRVDPADADKLRWVTARLSSCASAYSVPGLYSFAMWTGQPLATTVNVNAIYNFTSAAQQNGIVRALSRMPGLCIVYVPSMLNFLDRGQLATNPPLHRYITAEFAPVAEHEGYFILERRSSIEASNR